MQPYTKSSIGTATFRGSYRGDVVYPMAVDVTVGEHDTGFYNPNWRNQVALGLSATTSRTLTAYRQLAVPGYWMGLRKFGDNRSPTWSGFVPAGIATASVTSALDGPAEFQAKQRLASQIRDGVHFAGTIAELGSTLKMLRRPFASLVSALEGHNSRVRNRLKRQAGEFAYLRSQPVTSARVKRMEVLTRSSTRLAADAWLLTAFGLKPTINDIREAGETLLGFCASPGGAVLRSSGKNETISGSKGTAGLDSITWKATTYRRNTTRVYYKVRLTAEPFSAPNLHLGLAPWDATVGAWEAVPFSWLVDYVLPIGAALDMNAVFRSTKFDWCSHTIKRTSTAITVTEPGGSGAITLSAFPSRFTDQRCWLIRDGAIPSASFPTLNKKFSLCRGLNVAALIAGRLIT